MKDGSPLMSGSLSSPETEVDVAGGSFRRPIKLSTITRWWKEATATVVVSRHGAEVETHIDLIYRGRWSLNGRSRACSRRGS